MGHTCEWDLFISIHKEQLASSGVPQYFWKAIYDKLSNQVFDIGGVVKLLKFEKENDSEFQPNWGLQSTTLIDKSDPNNVFLIDHAWTFRLDFARKQLLHTETLRKRMGNLLQLDYDLPKNILVDEILKHMWSICFSYSISNADDIEDRLPIWYIMDEIGSALIHKDTPNCRIVPFFYSSENITYSLLFPIENINIGEFLCRDFVEDIHDANHRKIALLPWLPNNLDDISMIPIMPDQQYYLEGHIPESLPILDNLVNLNKNQSINLKVFTQYSMVKQYLSCAPFELVENQDDADILWLTEHFKDFLKLSETPEKFVNQFPFEYVITIKDLLALTCRRSNQENIEDYWPKWMPITYNLKTELPNFVAYFKHRESKGLDNFWIMKPYNLARGMDTHITNNLNCIIRVSSTLPKIVQKYIENPVLFHRPECHGYVKFDIRYVILLKSVKPLEAYVYKKFFLRFANVPFTMDNFDIYEKHFTVMNYNADAELRHMLCEEFLLQWQEQYHQYEWHEVEQSICSMLKEILVQASSREPPCGIADSPQSRALYAADIMLEWDKKRQIRPKILEINWTPDCKRACEYYSYFFNDIFKLLFLDEECENVIKL
ncbi:hypothetical protein WA026_003059 [Henosepilachna vigintioctopunctata]|uniref:Tubulin--tyrosine ligase-like protein 12 SET-like domain-containing protein n=1 Tax=Henosepilachna vigintioctopunctata TaxID=420089 RepID=A0AAW1TH42_9CUCU